MRGVTAANPRPAFSTENHLYRCVRFVALCVVYAFQTLSAAETKPIPIARTARSDKVSFHREILPLLKANCLPCHNQTRAKGELILETPATMLKGGDSGPALVPGKPMESRLLQAAAHQLSDLVMPPGENKVNARDLTPAELSLLALWIEQGAQSETVEATAIAWGAFPANWVSSFAVALTGDGQSVAVARANRIFLYDAKTGRLSQELSAPDVNGTAQHDWVSALAFSPDGEVLAAAGYREVRLWRQSGVTAEPAWPSDSSGSWIAAKFSNDRQQVGLITSDGELEIRNSSDGRIVRSWPLNVRGLVRIAWSDDNRFLALAGAEGVLQVISATTDEKPIVQIAGGEVAALAWFDHGQQLATVVLGKNVIQTWRRPESTQASTNLLPSAERSGHGATIMALASESGVEGSFISADAEGNVRRWFPDTERGVQELSLKGSVIGLDSIGPGPLFVARVAEGGARLISFEKDPKVVATFGGDPSASKHIAALEDELAVSRAELARAATLITEAETALKTGDETLKKAREKREGHAKALADKEKDFSKQREIETASTKERDDLASELQRIVEAAQAADKSLEEARAVAKEAAEKDGAAQVAASAAERLKTELDRLVASVPESDTGDAAVKMREAAASASAEAAARSAKRAEAGAKAEQAREELATRAFAAGQKAAEKKRAEADLPPRKKQAEERLAAAQKAIKDLQPQVDKARITLDGSTQDVALGEKSVGRANETLAGGKDADETARKRIAAADAQLAGQRAALERASASPMTACASTSASALLTLSSNGLAHRWDLTSGVTTATFTLNGEPPLAVAALDADQFITVRSNSVLRINTARKWALQRSIGSAEASSVSGPFIDRVNALAFSPDGQWLATGGGEPSRSGELKIWNVSDGELVRDLGGIHSDCVMALAFSPRGEWLATGGADRFARITPVSGDGPRLNLEGHTQHVLDVAWLADGSTLASAGAEGMVKLWNTKTGERRKNVEGFGKEVTGLEPIGATNQFVAVSGSGQGRIFRADGEKVRDLATAPAFLQALAVTRNGTLIAATDDQGTLRLWDQPGGKILLTIPPK